MEFSVADGLILAALAELRFALLRNSRSIATLRFALARHLLNGKSGEVEDLHEMPHGEVTVPLAGIITTLGGGNARKDD